MPMLDELGTDPITMEDVCRQYPPRPLLNPQPAIYRGEVIAIGEAVYEAVGQEAYDNRRAFWFELGQTFAPGNIWLLPTYERMTYPLAAYWPLACAFAAEKEHGRRFDWYLWMDDDALFSPSDVTTLLDAAKKQDLSFLAALPYDRKGAKQPAVMEEVNGELMKWAVAPKSGCYPVDLVGFMMCLFRRDVFEMVPEPWFGICGPKKGFSGIMPDWWWCYQMKRAGLQPWVCCDTNLVHLGQKEHVGRAESEAHFHAHGIPECAQRGPVNLMQSPRTGAIVMDAVVHNDGRTERIEEKNPDWSNATVVILTCEKHKEMLDLCLRGIKAFWPTIQVKVMLDTDRTTETELPDDIRAVARELPFLRKVFDLPWIAQTDDIYTLDSDCFCFDAPREWFGYKGLYVMPGSAGKDWLAKAADVWAATLDTLSIDAPEIDTRIIFCGGCWSADRRRMFDADARAIAIEYVRECVRRGYHKIDPGGAVICEQVLLNGLWHRAHTKNPLPNHRFPLDLPNPHMAIFHMHQQKDSPVFADWMAQYRKVLEQAEARNETR